GRSAALGVAAAIPSSAFRGLLAGLGATPAAGDAGENDSAAAAPSPLKPPAQGSIPVGVLISDGAVIIDFCGPWEVFQDVSIPGRADNALALYTAAETTKPIQASAGMKIVPDYTFANAPAPKVIVIPAQGGRSAATLDWIRKSAKSADVVMSVCTGAFLL